MTSDQLLEMNEKQNRSLVGERRRVKTRTLPNTLLVISHYCQENTVSAMQGCLPLKVDFLTGPFEGPWSIHNSHCVYMQSLVLHLQPSPTSHLVHPPCR